MNQLKSHMTQAFLWRVQSMLCYCANYVNGQKQLPCPFRCSKFELLVSRYRNIMWPSHEAIKAFCKRMPSFIIDSSTNSGGYLWYKWSAQVNCTIYIWWDFVRISRPSPRVTWYALSGVNCVAYLLPDVRICVFILPLIIHIIFK